MRIHLLIVFVGACLCAGCSESRAERPDYVPPRTISDTEEATPLDPFRPHNPDCICEDCDCDPCECWQTESKSQPRSDAMRPGYTLSLLTAQWCVNCPAAKSAAYEASVPVEIVDLDHDSARAAELWGDYSKLRSIPAWVLSHHGKPVRYWHGPSNASGIEVMAASEPIEQPARRERIQRYQPQPKFVPQQRYQYQQPRRGPIRRFFGGCANGRCG